MSSDDCKADWIMSAATGDRISVPTYKKVYLSNRA